MTTDSKVLLDGDPDDQSEAVDDADCHSRGQRLNQIANRRRDPEIACRRSGWRCCSV